MTLNVDPQGAFKLKKNESIDIKSDHHIDLIIDRVVPIHYPRILVSLEAYLHIDYLEREEPRKWKGKDIYFKDSPEFSLNAISLNLDETIKDILEAKITFCCDPMPANFGIEVVYHIEFRS